MEWAACTSEYFYTMQCVVNKEVKRQRKRKICAMICTYIIIHTERKKRKYWVSPLLKKREEHGFYCALFPTLHLEDFRFHNYLRMSATQLEELLQLTGAEIQKQYAVRAPIAVQERMIVTLRYLASGDSITSLSYQYLLGVATVSSIIKEVCEVIWKKLQPSVLPDVIEEHDWLEIAEGYEKRWDFPHCIGAIDGKHVIIQCPDSAGSSYFNYKGSHSIVLLAICDYNYIFRFIDVGAYGRRSDGGIFMDSTMGKRFNCNQMNIPAPAPICSNGKILPYCLIGDEAFPLKPYLLRPYPGKNLKKDFRVFNYRQSRARKTIEDSFGILSSRWRIYRKSIVLSVSGVKKIIKATVCLHNWLRMQDIREESALKYFDSSIDGDEVTIGTTLKKITHAGSNYSAKVAVTIRDDFKDYFNAEGYLDWILNFI